MKRFDNAPLYEFQYMMFFFPMLAIAGYLIGASL